MITTSIIKRVMFLALLLPMVCSRPTMAAEMTRELEPYDGVFQTGFYEPSPWAKAQGFRSADMIWLNYRRCSLTYRRMTCSSTFPTVSAKYPSAQKLSPQRNSSNSGYSFLITRLVPPFNLCTTSATLSVGFVWMIRWTWSSWILSSLAHHLFIRHASYNNPFRRTTILPRSTRRRYFGIQTTWYCRRCFV